MMNNSISLEEEVDIPSPDWTIDLSKLPDISHKHIHNYLVVDQSFDNKSRGANKHKIKGYQLYKENYVKMVKVKPNIKAEKLSFIVKCLVSASMKKIRYTVYVHLCQGTGDILYGKCSCKAGAGGCCKHVAALLYQLVDYKQLDMKVVPDDKTWTDVLQKWHVPGEGPNIEPIKFSDLTFEKANISKDNEKSRKRPIVGK